MTNREREEWNVFFLINISNEIEKKDVQKINNTFSKIIIKYRSVARLYDNCFINVITYGNNEIKEIITKHPLEEPIHLNLKFEGNGNILDAINFLKKRIEDIKDKKLYSPTIISFIKNSINADLEKELLLLNNLLGFRPFNYDYPEIFINQFIDDNYLIFLDSECIKKENENLGNTVYFEDVESYSFQGEIKEKNEINLVKLPTFKNKQIAI